MVFEGKRVFIIEDEQIIADLMQHILEMSGYTSKVAFSGAEAESALSDLHDGVDLVILDYSLPDIKGNEMLLKVRQFLPQARVLLTSGYNMDMLEGIEPEQVDGFLKKPFDMREIQAKVEKALQ